METSHLGNDNDSASTEHDKMIPQEMNTCQPQMGMGGQMGAQMGPQMGPQMRGPMNEQMRSQMMEQMGGRGGSMCPPPPPRTLPPVRHRRDSVGEPECWSLWRCCPKLRNNKALLVDLVSRVLFPGMFVMFNAYYWCLYCVPSADMENIGRG